MSHLLLKPRKYSDTTHQTSSCRPYAVHVQPHTLSLTELPSPSPKTPPGAAES